MRKGPAPEDNASRALALAENRNLAAALGCF
jgi:hypothetical protein